MVKTAKAAKNGLANKGGSKNFIKGRVDQEHLADKMKDYVKSVGSAVDEDNSLWSACGIRPKALAGCHEFVMAMLVVSPHASINYSDLKAAITNVLMAIPEAKVKKGGDISSQGGDIADRGVVLQSHLRRLATGSESEALMKKATLELNSYPSLLKCLRNMVSIVKVAWSEMGVRSPSPSPTRTEASVSKAGHVLLMSGSEDDSDVTVGSDGMPCYGFLKGGKKSAPPSEGDADALAGSIPPPRVKKARPAAAIEDDTADKIDTVMRKPSAATKIGTAMKKPSAAIKIDTATKIDIPSARLEGPFTLQSYIIHKPAEGKKQLVVGCTKSKTTKFHKVLQEVLGKIKANPGCTKAMAVKWRDDIAAGI